MTNYKRYSEEQRNDPVLRKAVEAELLDVHSHLSAAMNLLQRAYDRLSLAKELEEDSLDQSSGLIEAKVNIKMAINRFGYAIKNKPNETYIGNVAASMSLDAVNELKEKYAN